MISETNVQDQFYSIFPPKFVENFRKVSAKKPRNRAIEDLNAVYGGGGRVVRNIVNLGESYVELKLKGNTPTLHLLRSSSNAFIFS